MRSNSSVDITYQEKTQAQDHGTLIPYSEIEKKQKEASQAVAALRDRHDREARRTRAADSREALEALASRDPAAALLPAIFGLLRPGVARVVAGVSQRADETLV